MDVWGIYRIFDLYVFFESVTFFEEELEKISTYMYGHILAEICSFPGSFELIASPTVPTPTKVEKVGNISVDFRKIATPKTSKILFFFGTQFLVGVF